MVGLNTQSTADSTSYADIDFAVFCSGATSIHIYEKGKSVKNNIRGFSPGDTVQIVVNQQGRVEYFLNRLRVFTSNQRVTYPLHADVSIKQYGGAFSDVH